MQLALKELADDDCQQPNTRVDATGLIKKMDQFETAVMSVIWGAVLERFNKVNKLLQSVEIDLGLVEELYNSLITFVQEARDSFDDYEDEAKSFAEVNEYSADLKRHRMRKRFHDESSSAVDTEFTGRTKLKSEVNIMLDRLLSELDRRKNAYSLLNSRLGFLSNLHLLDAITIRSKARALVQMYPTDLEDVFVEECIHFKSFVPKKITDGGRERKPNALDLIKIIREKNLESTFPYVDVVLRMFLSTAATNCSGERSFSALKRVKSVFRSTMGQIRLNSLSLLNIESWVLDFIDTESLIDCFCELKDRRKV